MTEKIHSTNLIEEIAKIENDLVLNAKNQYGVYYDNCIKTFEILRTITSSNAKAYVFSTFWSQLLIYSSLYILSLIRKHTVQSNLILRSIYEILCYAMFSLHETNYEVFADITDGYLKPNKKAKDKVYNWLSNEFKEHSDFIKDMKSKLNDLFIHANIFSAIMHVKHFPDEQKIRALCFDDEENLYITEALLLDFTNQMLFFAKVIIEADLKHRILNFPDNIEDELELIHIETSKYIQDIYVKGKSHIDEVLKSDNF